jgi:hypothetical protein
MNYERLAEAIRVLKEVHEKNLAFDYTDWGEVYDSHTCETVACAGGYLTLHAPFNAQGLWSSHRYYLTPLYGDYIGVSALAKFFDISFKDADAIFVFAHKQSSIGKECPQQVTALDIANLLQNLLITHQENLKIGTENDEKR